MQEVVVSAHLKSKDTARTIKPNREFNRNVARSLRRLTANVGMPAERTPVESILPYR